MWCAFMHTKTHNEIYNRKKMEKNIQSNDDDDNDNNIHDLYYYSINVCKYVDPLEMKTILNP